MIHSMTGYGRAEETVDGRTIVVEIKSVNHRYFEFSSRIPRSMGFLEDRLKSYVQSRIFRGKVDMYVSVDEDPDAEAAVQINHSLAAGYIKALRSLTEQYGIIDDISVSSVARYSDVFTVRKAPEDEEALWERVHQVAAKAMDAFVAMRQAEGANLKADVQIHLHNLSAAVERVEEMAPQTIRMYRERLENKMRELLGGASVDEQRLLTETALFADRIVTDEETVRLRSHIGQISTLLNGNGAAGRKLDFLIQETNREINTIGSKAQNADIARLVVDMKAEIEKIREQIQNIE